MTETVIELPGRAGFSPVAAVKGAFSLPGRTTRFWEERRGVAFLVAITGFSESIKLFGIAGRPTKLGATIVFRISLLGNLDRRVICYVWGSGPHRWAENNGNSPDDFVLPQVKGCPISPNFLWAGLHKVHGFSLVKAAHAGVGRAAYRKFGSGAHFGSTLFESYGVVKKDFVTIPDALLQNAKELKKYL